MLAIFHLMLGPTDTARHGYTIQTVSWAAPPGMSASLPSPESCTGQGYLPLHALGLDAYESVVVYDPHVL